MKDENYTIKDIARMAGVSAGTVDRVLHNRGNVSASSREKVQSVLDKINYLPNMFAIGLAAKKRYRIVCLIPYYIMFDYWYSVAQGIEKAAHELQPFNVETVFLYYKHADRASYREVCEQLLADKPDAVLIAPNFEEETLELTTGLDADAVPYAFIDFNMEQMHASCYIGQDSKQSGYIAAKILMSHYREGEELVLFLNNQKDNPAEIQMQRRLEGFMQYISDEYSGVAVHEIILHKEEVDINKQVLDKFFSEHSNARLGAVFNSRVYQVADYLRIGGEKHLRSLVGYDLLPKNVEYLKSGEVFCLIGQRPALQAYYGVKALCNHVVFKKPIDPIRYMPIDILLKENIDFYFELE